MLLTPEEILENNRAAAGTAVEKMGGIAAVARELSTPEREIKAGHVWAWINRDKRGVPLEYLERIELLSGIPREKLRCDVPWRPKVDINEHI